jgi:2-amino-4-hydroxy-6-hydroxymethyldihydropteridine diphosphokinase
MEAVLSLGANLGDRRETLRSALHALRAEIDVIAVSSVYETDPWGGVDQPDYFNIVALVDADGSPSDLLRLAQHIEQDHGRTRDVRWGARTLDIDVVMIDGVVSDDPELTLPHPHAHERAFVLVPWAELDPNAVLPGHGRVGDLAAKCEPSAVRLVGGLFDSKHHG